MLVPPKGLVTRNMTIQAHTFKKLLARLKFLKSFPNFQVKMTRFKNVGTHGKSTLVRYQISSTQCTKVISKVKVFPKIGQTLR